MIQASHFPGHMRCAMGDAMIFWRLLTCGGVAKYDRKWSYRGSCLSKQIDQWCKGNERMVSCGAREKISHNYHIKFTFRLFRSAMHKINRLRWLRCKRLAPFVLGLLTALARSTEHGEPGEDGG